MKNDYEKLRKKLTKCKEVDVNEIQDKDVDEISTIKIDKRKSSNERILDFLCKAKNPYIFKCDGVIVKISFSDNSNMTADDCLTNVLKRLYR